MAGYAFFRLLWRPAFAFLLPASGVVLVLLFVMTLNEDLERARQLDLSMLAFPLMLGMLVGQTVHDVRYRFFSWTLPRFHWKLGASVVGIALLSALAWSWAYRSLGGEIQAAAAFTGFLLVFMAFAAVQRAAGVAWVALLLAVIWAGPFFGFLRAQPVAWTVLALAGAAAAFHDGFCRPSSRRLLLSAHRLMGVNLFNRIELTRATEEALKRSSRPRPWRTSFVGTEIRDWVRAVEYGSRGAASRTRTVLGACAFFGFMGLCIVSPAFMNDRSFASGLEHAYHVLFDPPVQLAGPTFVPVPLFLAVWAWSLVFPASGAFQRGWVYPVSRRLRSLVIYRLSLRQNLFIAWLLSLTFVFYAALIILLRGEVGDLTFLPGYFRGVIAVIVLLPAVQWIRPSVDRAFSSGGTSPWYVTLAWLAMVPFAGLVSLSTYLWPRLFAGVAWPAQAALLIALTLAAQGLYYRVVTHRMQRADLI